MPVNAESIENRYQKVNDKTAPTYETYE